MPEIPSDHSLDSTLAFLRSGYGFVSERADRLGTDIFQTRLLLRRTICMRGERAARVFYDPERMQREGSAPGRLQKTLFGQGGVQGLDGREHQHRKALFMDLMTPEALADLAGHATTQWRGAIRSWQTEAQVVLIEGVHELLMRAVCGWANVPLAEPEVSRRTQDMAAMIDAAAGVGPRHWRGRRSRSRSEAWGARLIEGVRGGQINPRPQTALHAMAWHRDRGGELLEPRIAAVELLNVLRPTVAVARYVVFLALALHEHPPWRQRLRAEFDRWAEPFVQEVRRTAPFFPVVAARVRHDFDLDGLQFPAGRRVLLDLYGTNRHGEIWDDPHAFRPERCMARSIDAYDLIPQGGGDHREHHRCAGEWVTIELMKVSLGMLVSGMQYTVPEQDLSVDLGRMPAQPRSGFRIADVQMDVR